MELPQKLLARSVVLFLLLGMLPALQQPAAVVAQDTATYNLTKFDCPPGYDPGSSDASAAFANCVTPAAGVQFTLTSGDASYGGGTQATDGSGYTGWSGIPLGSGYSISESIPPGYGTPWVYCEVSGDPNNPGNVQQSYFQAPGGTMDVGYTDPSLTTYTQANCTWFDITPNDVTANLQPQDQEGGETPPQQGTSTVTIRKQLCPLQYPSAGVPFAQLRQDCPGAVSGVPFTIGGDGGSLQVTDVNGMVTWPNVNLGAITIQEEASANTDTARVFCQSHPATDTSVTYSDADEVQFGLGANDTQSVTVSLPQDNRIDCLWFDVLVTQTDLGSVVFGAYACPDGYDAQTSTFENLISNCAPATGSAAFQLVQSTGNGEQSVGGNGSAPPMLPNITPGNYYLSQSAPAGVTVARTFCQDWNVYGGGSGPGFGEVAPSEPGQIKIDLAPGHELTCYWFDTTGSATADTTESTTTGSITITKYLCYQLSLPLNSPGPDYDIFSSQCTEYGQGIDFIVSTNGGDLNATTGADGVVAFDGLESGPVTVSESLPAGYDSWGVYCTTDSSGGSYVEYGGEQVYEFDYTVESGVQLTCSWFDQAPEADAYVSVAKYICEEGDVNKIDPGYLDYVEDCQDPGSGWNFTLSGGASPITKTTGASGDATFGAAAGAFTLSEEEQPGYASIALYCNDGSNADAWDAVPLTGASGSIELAAGQTRSCVWFNYRYPDTGQTITITKYTCKRFLVRGWPAKSDYEANCTEWASGVEFRVYAGMQLVDTQTTDASGVAVLSVPTAGSYQIVETPVEGYITGAVYCLSSVTDDPAQAETFPLQVAVTADYPVTCTWYNGKDILSGITQEPGAIVVHKADCLPGYPADGMTGFESLLEGCTVPAPDITFSVNQGGSQIASGATDAMGEVALEGAAAGDTRISELPIEGWDPPRVFCASVPVGIGRNLVDYQEQTVSTWGIDYDIQDDTWLDCYWFDRPPYQGTDGQPIQIVVQKIVCDPDVKPGDTLAGAQTECQTPEEGVEFTLTDSAGTASGPTDANGYAEYNGLTPGSIAIAETPREGYSTGAVFCTFSAGSYVSDAYLMPIENDAIETYVAPGYKLECYWYNTVEPETGHVYVFKYTCPAGTTASSQNDLEASCTEKQAGVSFSLTNPAVPDPLTAETDSSGLAAWYDVPAGDWTLTETPPAGYDAYVVYCGESDVAYIPPAIWEAETLSAAESSVEIEVRQDTYTMCNWYNIESNDNPEVWISKYNCGDDAGWHWDYQELSANCTEPAPNVKFQWAPKAGNFESGATDDQGQLLLDALEPGQWVIGEEFPSGYSGAVAFCQFENGGVTGEFQQAAVDNGAIWLELIYGDVVSCYWFDFPESVASPTPPSGSGGSGGSGSTPPPPLSSNVPTGGGSANQQTDPNAPATLIIVKRTCPAGYDLYADNAGVELDCPDPTKDIGFELTSLAPNVQNGTPVPNEPVPQTTGDDGKATWANLTAGPYLLVETMPEDTHAAFIWTCTSDQRQFQLEYPLTPFSYAGPEGETGVTLIPGETLECAWYDVPTAPGTIALLLFDCPGSPVIVAQCQPAGDGIAFTLAPIGTVGPILSLTTDEAGAATAEGVGVYSIAEDIATPCLIDSEAIDDQGYLVVEDGSTVEVKIYNCGGGS